MTRPIDIAWPANAKEIAREILDYVTDGDTRPLLVHAFSVSSHVRLRSGVAVRPMHRCVTASLLRSCTVVFSPGIATRVSTRRTPTTPLRSLSPRGLQRPTIGWPTSTPWIASSRWAWRVNSPVSIGVKMCSSPMWFSGNGNVKVKGPSHWWRCRKDSIDKLQRLTGDLKKIKHIRIHDDPSSLATTRSQTSHIFLTFYKA